MRLKLTYNRHDGSAVDVAVTADGTATVRDVANALYAGDPLYRESSQAGEQIPPDLTLQTAPEHGAPSANTRILPPTNDLLRAGLRSGATVSIVRLTTDDVHDQSGAAAAALRVLEGPDAGREFHLPMGTSSIGRGIEADVRLTDSMVSKVHAQIVVGETVEIIDANSANGVILGGRKVARTILGPSDRAGLGSSVVAIAALRRSASVAPTTPQVEFHQSPRVVVRFPETVLKAPEPPRPAEPQPLPFISMIAPLLMGGVMYAVTRSALSIVFVALSPLLMIGAWLDQRFQERRRFKRQVKEFKKAVDDSRQQVVRAHEVERAVRISESPALSDAIDAVQGLGGLMWTHRPEHDGFLTARLGLGTQDAWTRMEAANSANTLPEYAAQLADLVQQCSSIDDVPVVARLRVAGGFGLAGPTPLTDAVGRSVLFQLVALHSPADLVVCGFASPQSRRDWAWLEWVPHIGSPHSPLEGPHLADNPGAAAALMARLEELIASRGPDFEAPAPRRGDIPADQERKEAAPEPTLPSIVVLVEDDAVTDRARLIRLAERGPDAGVYVIWVAPTVESLPAACRSFVRLDPADSDGASRATAGEVRFGREIHPVVCETLDLAVAHRVARHLAPVVDVGAAVEDASDLPRSVSFLTMAGTELADSPDFAIEHWRENGSLILRDGSPAEPRTSAADLRALVGHSGLAPLYLDLRSQGPHALVGGTTGAGKSEFLQSWVLGMAAAHSPDRVTFLFVDYKGGAAFADCIDLPHSVGLVTDLSPHLVRRALTSLRAELRHRERVLNLKKAKDLVSLERTGDPDAPPSLVIVVDEFAALVSEVPEFVDGMVDVAQRGRSLGLHLILATQRPAGVIKDNLRANTNLRVALRMADEEDSSDVLGVPMAAHFDPAVPGRGAVRTGPGRIQQFQAAYAGGWTTEDAEASRVEVEALGFGTETRWEVPAPPIAERRDAWPPDIARAVATISKAAAQVGVPQPRRPWLPELLATYELADLAVESDARIPIGMADLPDTQAQEVVYYEPDRDGNMAVFGASGAGKSAALRTIAIAAGCAEHGPVMAYAIDAGSRGLHILEDLPHVGSVIDVDDEERVGRVLRLLREIVDERSSRYASVRAGGIAEYRRLADAPDEPRVLLLVDGIGAFREAYEYSGAATADVFGMFSTIATDGRAVGVHVVVAGDRSSSVPTSLGSTLQKRLVLRMANEDEYMNLGVPRDVLSPTSPPGRGVLDDNEVQVAVLGGHANVALQAREVARLRATMLERGVAQAPEVRSLPDSFALSTLPVLADDEQPAFGLDDRDLAPVGVPARGAMMLAGPPAAGRTTALVTLARAVGRAGRARTIYLAPRQTSVSRLDVWSARAVGEETVQQVVAEASAAVAAERFRAGELAIFIEEVTDFTGTSVESDLEELIRACVRADLLVVGEAETSTWGQAWSLAQPFKSGRTGLLLTPGDVDGDTLLGTDLGRLRRKDFPAGRGFLVTGGHPRKVHVALPE